MAQVLRRLRTRILWMAALAVLFGSVAPTLTTFLASSSGQTWIEVCTSTGTKLVAVDTGEAPDDQEHKVHTGVHCPYCRLQQDMPAIAHAPGVLVLADGSVRGVPPPPAQTTPLVSAIWPAHHSRAPPAFS